MPHVEQGYCKYAVKRCWSPEWGRPPTRRIPCVSSLIPHAFLNQKGHIYSINKPPNTPTREHMGKQFVMTFLRSWVSRKLISIALLTWKDRSLREEGGRRSAPLQAVRSSLKSLQSLRLSKALGANTSRQGQTNSSPLRNYPGFKFSLSHRRIQLCQGWVKNIKKKNPKHWRGIFLSQTSHLGEASCHVWPALWRPMWWGTEPPANNHVTETGSGLSSSSWASEITAALAN